MVAIVIRDINKNWHYLYLVLILALQAQRLRHSFEVVVKNSPRAEISLKEMSEMLMNDMTKDDNENQLPRIYPREFEYPLSAIFVEADTPLVTFFWALVFTSNHERTSEHSLIYISN